MVSFHDFFDGQSSRNTNSAGSASHEGRVLGRGRNGEDRREDREERDGDGDDGLHFGGWLVVEVLLDVGIEKVVDS